MSEITFIQTEFALLSVLLGLAVGALIAESVRALFKRIINKIADGDNDSEPDGQ